MLRYLRDQPGSLLRKLVAAGLARVLRYLREELGPLLRKLVAAGLAQAWPGC